VVTKVWSFDPTKKSVPVRVSDCLQGAGVVVAVGELVEEIKVGDHAGIKWLNGSCGHCEFCKFIPV